jgi:uncharacterized protein YjbJ (UPF0337 family)
MTEHSKADQARRGLIDTVKGKLKEVAGAVTGNDSLTAEGQLEQTQAHDRKEANSVEAVADAEEAKARAEAAEAKREGINERGAVNAEAALAKDAVRAEQVAHKVDADSAAQQSAAVGEIKADLEAQRAQQQAKAAERQEVGEAVDDIVDAVGEHRTADRVTANAHDQADRIRQSAADLTEDADLP